MRNAANVEDAIRETLRDLKMYRAADAMHVIEFGKGVFTVGWKNEYVPALEVIEMLHSALEPINAEARRMK
jgi:hypothetical protein